MTLIADWKKRVDAALAALGMQTVVFATTLQARCPEYAKFHDHTGQECTIVAAILEPGQDYDEESLPYYRVRFADGVELEADDAELFGKTPEFFGVLTAVSGAFAVARGMDFVGPTHLEQEATEVTKVLFENAVAAYRIDSCAQNFNCPEEFRTKAETARGHTILEEGREQSITMELAGQLQVEGLIYPQGGDALGFWHITDGKTWADIDAALKAHAERSPERQALCGLISMVEELMLGGLTQDGLRQLVDSKLSPARALLLVDDTQRVRIGHLEEALGVLIDGFDTGHIEGLPHEFAAARETFERAGKLTFSNWIAGVCAEMGVDEVTPSAYRSFYDKGMRPAEAVLQERLDSGVMEG
ncbi:hypothetical protein [Ottowia sp.]|uniref:hypothetical protein n=1 Tax=Ottowia sp. TaxID=1898956 RepID=UPI0025DFD7E5|nr:hypothetical protein [Ottowia sp.]MBK6616540.1 hypothetical protein [Ottowia sp.]